MRRKGDQISDAAGQHRRYQVFSQGVMVVGLSPVVTENGDLSPARACGLKEGDIITHINSEPVDTIEEVRDVLQELEGKR